MSDEPHTYVPIRIYGPLKRKADMADELAKALEYCAQAPGTMHPQSQAQYRIARDALLKYREIV